MPHITERARLESPFLKRNVKLLPCQREMIHYWYKAGTGINGIARIFKVSKRLIQFELFPERLAKNKQDRAARGGSKQYYNKEYHSNKIKEHRNYKYKILVGITPRKKV